MDSIEDRRESPGKIPSAPMSSNKKSMPPTNPVAAGNHAVTPCSVAMSIDGISNDQTDAAIITPEAKPSNIF